ncbi:MAG: trypsin-like peptidase domain-containing protein [Patescibacteria group bacterium]
MRYRPVKFYKYPVILFALVCLSSVCFAEDPAPVKLEATQIAELYSKTIVDVSTIIRYEFGSIEFGGSGFYINENAQLLTNAHVVSDPFEERDYASRLVSMSIENGVKCWVVVGKQKTERKYADLLGMFGPGDMKPTAFEYWVTMGNRKYKAELVGSDKYRDVAMLHVLDIARADYTPCKLGNSDLLKVGEEAYAYGTPYGLSKTFTSGHISALHRYIDLNYVEDFIQMDTPINPGNSGSPLINGMGEVIGINAAGVRGANNLGFAIAINFVNVEKLSKGGVVKIGYLGAEVMLDNFPRTGTPGEPGFRDLAALNAMTDIDHLRSLELLANLTYPNGDDKENRALTLNAEADSPAGKALLKRGDMVVEFNGKSVKSGRDVRLGILESESGKEFEIKVRRVEKGSIQELTLKVTLLKEKPKKQ